MRQSPNRLGTALSYIAEGYRFAFPETTGKASPRRVSLDLLDAIAESSKYNSSETVDVAQAIKLAITSAWFYSGSKLIADRVSATDARPVMKQRINDELRAVPGHDFSKLLDRPNSMMTWEYISRYTVGWLELNGNGYIFISTPEVGRGRPEELWPLPANVVKPLPSTIHPSKLTGQPVVDYEYILNGKARILPGENVIHIRYANPFDYWMGLSPLTALMDAVRLDRYQSKYLQGFFGKDNAIPTAIISLPQETGDADFDIIKEQIREQFGQGRRSAITRAGDMSVQVITQTLQQMEIVNARKMNREEINHVLGIPDGLVSGGQSGDSRLATEITFARNTTQPLLDLIASSMDTALSPYYGKGFVICPPSIIPQDRSLALQEYEKYSQDRSINENRKVLNLEPLDLPGIMGVINEIRTSSGLDEINTPLDTVMLDLLLFVPIRLIPLVSSNTSPLAALMGLRVGQKDASGEVVKDPFAESLRQQKEQQDTLYGDQGDGEDTGDGGDQGDAGDAGGDPVVPGKPTGAGNMPAPKKSPDMTGALTGSHFVGSNAARSFTPAQVAAIKLGQTEELSKWKKVSQRSARDGKNPADKSFVSSALPNGLITSITKQIDGASELTVSIVFDAAITTLQEIEL